MTGSSKCGHRGAFPFDRSLPQRSRRLSGKIVTDFVGFLAAGSRIECKNLHIMTADSERLTKIATVESVRSRRDRLRALPCSPGDRLSEFSCRKA